MKTKLILKNISLITIIFAMVVLVINIIANFESDTKKVGIIDKNGNFVVHCKYATINSTDLHNNQKYMEASKYNGLLRKFEKLYIDLSGNEYSDDESLKFCEGRISTYSISLGKSGFVDYDGNKTSQFIYDSVYDYENGIAEVEIDGKYGLIDLDGKQILSCSYDEITPYSNNLFAVKQDDEFYLMNDTEQKLGIIQLEEEYNNYYRAEKILFYNINDFDFEKEFNVDEDEVIFSSNRIILKNNGKYGMFDKNGKMIKDFMYDEFKLLANKESSNNAYLVAIGGKEYIIDDFGNGLNEVNGRIFETFCNNLIVIKENEKFGVIKIDNKTILNSDYDNIMLYENYIVASLNKEYEVYDFNGNLLFKTNNPMNIFGNGEYFVFQDYNKNLVVIYSCLLVLSIIINLFFIKKLFVINKKIGKDKE